MDSFGFKDFENVSIFATSKLEIGKRIIEPNETIVFFDKIQIAGLQEIREKVSAHGGYGDRSLVFWDTAKALKLNFSQGVISKEQLSFLTNSNLVDSTNETLLITFRESLESDENGTFSCKYEPIRDIFIYKKDTGEKLNFIQSGKQITIEYSYTDIIIDYKFNYDKDVQFLKIGQRLFNGFVGLEGTTRVKDSTTGTVVTGLIKIPKIKILSDLSLKLGIQASPIVGDFQAEAIPVGQRASSYISEFYFLQDDIENIL